mgnify:CR=1 FL=1
MSAGSKPPNWSMQFLKIMVGIVVISPLVGALLYLLTSGFVTSEAEPRETALAGAKLGLLIGGFASPFAALGVTARIILRHKATNPENQESGSLESR